MTSGAITLLVIAILLVPLAGLFGAMDAAQQQGHRAPPVRARARRQGS